MGEKEQLLIEIKNDDNLIEIARRAIEDALIEFRDSRLSEFLRGNGLVVREKDGADSSIIRFGPETAMRIGLKAIAESFRESFRESSSPTPAGTKEEVAAK